MPTSAAQERFDQTLFIAAPPDVVYDCFFSADALHTWWRVVRSVTTPVLFGVYAVEWTPTPYRDEVLGPLGGAFHGTVVDVRPGRQFLLADCWWVPPEGDALGPMALQVRCKPHADGCRLHIRQEGGEPSPRWQRYYVVVTQGWQTSLTSLKAYAEAARADASLRR